MGVSILIVQYYLKVLKLRFIKKNFSLQTTDILLSWVVLQVPYLSTDLFLKVCNTSANVCWRKTNMPLHLYRIHYNHRNVQLCHDSSIESFVWSTTYNVKTFIDKKIKGIGHTTILNHLIYYILGVFIFVNNSSNPSFVSYLNINCMSNRWKPENIGWKQLAIDGHLFKSFVKNLYTSSFNSLQIMFNFLQICVYLPNISSCFIFSKQTNHSFPNGLWPREII